MKIILIAALDKGKVIGSKGSIPWRIQEALNYFKEKTSNKSEVFCDANKYFPEINKFFNDFLISTKLKVIIAAHPRSNY